MDRKIAPPDAVATNETFPANEQTPNKMFSDCDFCACGLTIVLLQETEQLFRRTINGQRLGLNLFLVQHVLKQLAAQTATLPGLVHVKVQNARRCHIHRLAVLVEHVQRFVANF